MSRIFFFVFLQLVKAIMNLIIDIGNTAAKIVAFQEEEPKYEMVTSNETLEGLADFLQQHPCEKGIVSSVIQLSEVVEQVLCALSIPLLRLNYTTPLPIQNQYRTPQTLGSDRLAAVVGAVNRCPGRELLIIDAGTCITYEFVDATGCYQGGNIAPGVWMRLHVLHDRTSKLPLISPEGDCPCMGYDTESAIRSGVMRGIRFEIEGYIRQFREKYPRLLVFLTGGDGFDFDSRIKSIIFADKYLVPRGLNCILEYNDK